MTTEITHHIIFQPQNTEIDVPDKTTVLQAEIQAGLQPDAPCGGKGQCGKCRVRIDGRTVLACQTPVERDITVHTIAASPIDAGQTAQILTSSPSPARQWTDSAVSNSVSSPSLPGFDFTGLNSSGRILAAFDIGTTTLVGYFMDRASGKLLYTASRMNPQYVYGADVISRADYVLGHGEEGRLALQNTILTAINEMLKEALANLNCSTHFNSSGSSVENCLYTPKDVAQISIVGNTCMHHLLLGLSPETLVKAPYVPLRKDGMVLAPRELDIAIDPAGRILLFPNIAGFVGGDTVGCLLACRPDLKEEISLIVDIGTNGEMALGNKDRILTTSTAAGPAFEGAKITCGMRGTAGAISHIYIGKNGFETEVIGNGKPAGICGSGLIDLMAFLICHGIVNSMGAFRDPDDLEDPIARKESDRIMVIEGRPAFLLAGPEESADGSYIYISQKDIREVQLAKAAIASGIEILSHQLDITCDQISQVYLAGAFGNYMNAENACEIGLLPWELRDRITGVGNAAGEGARLAALNMKQYELACHLAAQAGFVELATEKTFQDIFVDQLEFARGVED